MAITETIKAQLTYSEDAAPRLIDEIRAACENHRIAPSRFGRMAVRDPQFVPDVLRRNRSPRPGTVRRVRAFIASLGA